MRNYGALTGLDQIIELRKADVIEVNGLQTGKLQGRFRYGRRQIPTSPTDIEDSGNFKDSLGDIINDDTYVYTLLQMEDGSLAWDRRAVDFSW